MSEERARIRRGGRVAYYGLTSCDWSACALEPESNCACVEISSRSQHACFFTFFQLGQGAGQGDLEVKFQRKLDNSRRDDGVINNPKTGKSFECIGVPELRVVKEIEKLRSKLDVSALV